MADQSVLSIRGVQLVKPPPQRSKVPYIGLHFTHEADRTTSQALVKLVNSSSKLYFYDAQYPSPSDPGAYICLSLIKEQLAAMAGNHGWESGCVSISADEAISYLTICIPDNSKPPFGAMSLYQSSNFNPRELDPSPNNSLRQYINVRLRLAPSQAK